MCRAYSAHGRRDAFIILDGRPEGTRPLGRLRHGWEDNIGMDLKETGWEGSGLDSSC